VKANRQFDFSLKRSGDFVKHWALTTLDARKELLSLVCFFWSPSGFPDFTSSPSATELRKTVFRSLGGGPVSPGPSWSYIAERIKSNREDG
jgi:hypothetical protein